MDNKFYVYVYMDPSKLGKYQYQGLDFSFLYEPFYIGKGHNTRDMIHFNSYRLNKKTFMSNRINKIMKSGNEPLVVRLYENLTEDESFDKEILLIDKIGKRIKNKGPLVNLVDGGGGKEIIEIMIAEFSDEHISIFERVRRILIFFKNKLEQDKLELLNELMMDKRFSQLHQSILKGALLLTERHEEMRDAYLRVEKVYKSRLNHK